MKKIIAVGIVSSFVLSMFLMIPSVAEAKKVTFYKSAVTGRYTTKSYSTSHKRTTYKSSYKSRK